MEKPNYILPSPNEPRGNIFVIIGEVTQLLKQKGKPKLAEELKHRIITEHQARSYNEAIKIIGEYVNVI